MLESWKTVIIIVAILAAVVAVAAFDLRCSVAPQEGTPLAWVRDEISVGKKEHRNLKADELAALARDLHALSCRYAEQGDKKKAWRAMGAVRELEKKIAELHGKD